MSAIAVCLSPRFVAQGHSAGAQSLQRWVGATNVTTNNGKPIKIILNNPVSSGSTPVLTGCRNWSLTSCTGAVERIIRCIILSLLSARVHTFT